MKNKDLPLNRDARAFKGSERAQSDSSLETWANCPAYYAYNYGLFAHRGKLDKFVWFIYGSVIHQIADEIRTEVLVKKKPGVNGLTGKALNRYLAKYMVRVYQALDSEGTHRRKGKSEDFLWLPRETIEKNGPVWYKEKIAEKLKAYADKARNTLKAVYLSTQVQTNFKYNKYEWRFSSQKVRVPNLHNPNGLGIWLLGAFDELNYFDDWYIISDLKTGKKDNLKLQNNHQMLMYNYVSRNIDHASPSHAYTKKKVGGEEVKIPNPRMEHLTPFNGTPPREQFLVSLDIEPWALYKHGENVLYSEDFRLLVHVDFDLEWPEHHRFISDVAHEQDIMLKERDQNGSLFSDEFEPLSDRGKLIQIGRSVRENRFVPRIGPRCGLCPAKNYCQEDHPDDWNEYRDRQGIGVRAEEEEFLNFTPDTDSVEVEAGEIPTLPEIDLPYQPALEFPRNKPVRRAIFVTSAYKKRKKKDMEQLGFVGAIQLMARIKKGIRAMPFLIFGKCQCQTYKDLILPGDGEKIDLKLLSDPIALHKHMVEHCPLEDCLRRKEHEILHEKEDEKLKDAA